MTLDWAIVFFLLAVLAGVFGFTGVAGTFAWGAKVLFFIFLALLVISVVMRLLGKKPPQL